MPSWREREPEIYGVGLTLKCRCGAIPGQDCIAKYKDMHVSRQKRALKLLDRRRRERNAR